MRFLFILVITLQFPRASFGQEFQKLRYNHPGLAVDLGVGLWAWPMPMDFDGDGDLDLVVSCPDVPSNGTYFFENPGTNSDGKMPIFKPGKRLGPAIKNAQISYVDGKPRVLTPGKVFHDFTTQQQKQPVTLPVKRPIYPEGRVRANQWKLVDYDDDGRTDLLVGIGSWKDYGWDDAFNEKGDWTNGPLHGFVFLLKNTGTEEEPKYGTPEKLTAAGKPIDVYGMPSPNMADFDSDGDLDLMCGEFLDGFTYFENTGTRQKPVFEKGRKLAHDGEPIHMDLQMITPVAVDWDSDGDPDLICGDEDGRVAFLENLGKLQDGVPVFEQPRYFQQEASDVKFGALVTPVSFDWDGDGDEDLICGNSAGYIGFIENLDGNNPPKWAAPRLLEADGKVIRPQAGPNGSIQGPCEAKWGYTTLSVADWDHDGLPDIVINSIWGKIEWFRNVGTRKAPKLSAAKTLEVEWKSKTPKPEWNWWSPEGKELATQWRTTPVIYDLNEDGLNDLIVLDRQGYLAFFERERIDGKLRLKPPVRIFRSEGPAIFANRHQPQGQTAGVLQLNNAYAGRSGRRKLCIADWNQDGRPDFLVNSLNANVMLQTARDNLGMLTFKDTGPVSPQKLAGHTTSPTVVDWDKNGVPDLLLGAEDGFLYYLKNPHSPAK